MGKITNFIFLAIIAGGLTLRVWKLDIPLLEFYPTRQVQTAEITRNLYRDGFNILKPSVNYLGPDSRLFLVEFPGYNFIVALLYKIVGAPHENLGRIFSITGWLVASIFLFLLAKKIADTFVAMVALFFYSFSPLSVMVSRSFQPDQWMLTLSLFSIYLIVKSQDNGSRFLWYLSSIFVSLSVLTKLPSLIFSLIPVGYYFVKSKGVLFIDKFLYLMLAILPPLIWYFYVARANADIVNLQNSTEISTWFGLDILINPKYFSNIFGFEYNIGLLPIGMILFGIGVLTKLKKDQHFLYVWLGAVILYFLIFNKHNITHEYYHLPFLPIAAIFIGVGAEKVFNVLDGLIVSKKVPIFIFSILIFVMMLPPTLERAYTPIERFRSVPETAQAIKDLTKPDDLIIGAMDGGPVLVYYSERTGWFFDINSNKISEQEEIFGIGVPDRSPIEELEHLRQKGARIFAAANKTQFLSNDVFADYMYKNYLLVSNSNDYVIFDIKNKRSFSTNKINAN